jgi:hypothetical protein
MTSKALLVAAALVVAAAATASALAGRTPDGRMTETAFVLRFIGPTGFVDNPPTSRLERGIPAHLSPGDTLLAHSLVYDRANRQRLGRTSELCTLVVPKPTTFDCSMALLFDDGSELLVHGALNPMQPRWTAPVVGGRGRYAAARGSVKMSGLQTKQPAERWTFTLSG